jgi:leucyl aminopeptidase
LTQAAISLKPGEGMDAMKYDMSGGATFSEPCAAIAQIKPTAPVLGIVARVENMPEARPRAERYRHGLKREDDRNTETQDARAALSLPMLSHTLRNRGATRIVDMATLTGAVIIALGDQNTGIMGNDQELVDEDHFAWKRKWRRLLAASRQQGIQQADPVLTSPTLRISAPAEKQGRSWCAVFYPRVRR